MLDYGFFPHEPLIVIPSETHAGKYVVLEGNRRLVALKVLHNDPDADGVGHLDREPIAAELKRLDEVPCIVESSRADVRAFLGFRHIGGQLKWSAEAKARYIITEVKAAVERGVEEPFLAVGRIVGSNTQGVRTSYTALRILQYATDEFGIETQYIHHHRFGVWYRIMNSADIMSYIGFDRGREVQEIEYSLIRLKKEQLNEVLNDLQPQESRKPLISDSRQTTTYGRILLNDNARAALRKYGDFGIAAKVVNEASIQNRLRDLVDQCTVVFSEIERASWSETLESWAGELLIKAKSIKSVVIAKRQTDD